MAGMNNPPGTPRDDGEMGGNFLNPFQSESQLCGPRVVSWRVPGGEDLQRERRSDKQVRRRLPLHHTRPLVGPYAPPAPSPYVMSSYTCISCRVQFADGEVQRAHYKTDWHRYNLKRKVADMPPVTAENFQERVLAQRAAAEQQQNQQGHGFSACSTCNKKFSTENAYSNHLQSHKHLQAEKKALAAAQEVVQRMNEKNLEKGAELDKDAQNEALQKALREQQRHTPSKATPAEGQDRQRPDKAPRMQWFEQQAKKIAAEEGEEEEEEEVGIRRVSVYALVGIRRVSVYALVGIRHVSVYGLVGIRHVSVYALVGIRHIRVYALVGIRHVSVYALVGIRHVSVYALVGIRHVSVYALVGIRHVRVYALVGIRHVRVYALVRIRHVRVYALVRIRHVFVYALVGIRHVLVYALVGIRHVLVFALVGIRHVSVYALVGIRHVSVYALVGIRHIRVYALVEIRHSEYDMVSVRTLVRVYALVGIRHVSVYALVGIRHVSVYALVGIRHVRVYALVGIRHVRVYALVGIRHVRVYALVGIRHVRVYALVGIRHVLVYALVGIRQEWEDVGDADDDDDDDDDEMEAEEDEELEEGSSAASAAAPGAIPVTDCLFCAHHSRSLSKNMTHMTTAHSFFIPDVEFLVDLRGGRLEFLTVSVPPIDEDTGPPQDHHRAGEKVGFGKVCLWCNEKGKSFYSTEAVQAHMTDKSHCKLYTDGDAALEFADFYDFRSSYPDAKEGGDDVEMKDGELPEDKTVEFDDETLELTLPSGAKVGHRSLMRYYKQRFGTQRALTLAHNQRAVGRVLKQYRALGWGGDSGKGFVHQQQKDMQYVQRMKSRWMLKMSMNNNVTKQAHFRAQVMF
ncbi:hypothetical protein NFI96_014681 [Prochilodus magdalenae]|nr:hypothetical protein NFI96_014681 [Prochilodus magdalenae]